MATVAKKITPCLWFDGQAEAAAKLYTSVFPDSRITQVSRFNEVGTDIHGQQAGTVMTVAFELQGQPFTALNGGPMFKFTEAVSFQVFCDTQAEVDHYWAKLGDGGDPRARQCGWLKDRFGVSWQVVPRVLIELITGPDAEVSKRVTAAMLRMEKMDVAELERAARGA